VTAPDDDEIRRESAVSRSDRLICSWLVGMLFHRRRLAWKSRRCCWLNSWPNSFTATRNQRSSLPCKTCLRALWTADGSFRSTVKELGHDSSQQRRDFSQPAPMKKHTQQAQEPNQRSPSSETAELGGFRSSSGASRRASLECTQVGHYSRIEHDTDWP